MDNQQGCLESADSAIYPSLIRTRFVPSWMKSMPYFEVRGSPSKTGDTNAYSCTALHRYDEEGTYFSFLDGPHVDGRRCRKVGKPTLY